MKSNGLSRQPQDKEDAWGWWSRAAQGLSPIGYPHGIVVMGLEIDIEQGKQGLVFSEEGDRMRKKLVILVLAARW